MNVRHQPAAVLAVAALLAGLALPANAADAARLKGSARGARNGWITVRLQGEPSDDRLPARDAPRAPRSRTRSPSRSST